MENIENNKKEAAMAFAKTGFPVLPLHSIKNGICTCENTKCTRHGKHPHYDKELFPHGVTSASTDAKIVEKFWEKWPMANIGIATGTKSFIALDVDLPDGPNNLNKLESKFGKLPETSKNMTGGGGYQLLFKPSTRVIKNSSGTLSKNIDIRGDGGYIVVPPSTHISGKKYRWAPGFAIDEIGLSEMPNWLVDLIMKGQKYCEFIHAKKPITKGTRNDRLMQIAGYLRGEGYDYGDILNSLTIANRNRCKPPLADSEVGKIAKSATRYPEKAENLTKGDIKKEFLEKMLSLKIFCDVYHECWVSVPLKDRNELLPVNGKRFKQYLSGTYNTLYKKNLEKHVREEIISLIEAESLNNKIEQVHSRIAFYDGNIYLDLANNEGEIVEITEKKWSVIKNHKINFYHPPGMESLIIPGTNNSFKASSGSIVDKQKRFKVLTKYCRKKNRLLISWLIGTFNPHGPYPILVLRGGKGSAKSTTTEILKRLIDPAKAIRKTTPRQDRDLMITAKNNWILSYDNVSHLPQWLSDAFCRLSTGGGFATKKNYTDDEEIIFDSIRPLIINGIPDFITRPDLADRTIIIDLPEISDENRKIERILWAEFENDRAEILGVLLDAVVIALRNYRNLKIEKLPRMADFAHWVASAEDALPWKKGSFLKSYKEHLDGNLNNIYKQDPLTNAVLSLLKNDEKWEGPSTKLLTDLRKHVDPMFHDTLPKTPQLLSSGLKDRLSPLNHVGVLVKFSRTGISRSIILTLKS